MRHHFCECLPGPLMDAIGRAVAGRPADTCERKASMPSDARSQGPTMASGARLAVLRTASLAAPTPVSGTRPLTARTCRTFPSGPPSTKASPGGASTDAGLAVVSSSAIPPPTGNGMLYRTILGVKGTSRSFHGTLLRWRRYGTCVEASLAKMILCIKPSASRSVMGSRYRTGRIARLRHKPLN